jgi:hypothetical protein
MNRKYKNNNMRQLIDLSIYTIIIFFARSLGQTNFFFQVKTLAIEIPGKTIYPPNVWWAQRKFGRGINLPG